MDAPALHFHERGFLPACALSVIAVRCHLSQRERQEHCRELSHCTYYFSDTPYGLALPSGELARERLRGLPSP